MQILKIGQLAAEAAVGVDTVRYYERAGLMPKATRTSSGYRSYRAADVQRLKFIRRVRALGFTVEQIGALLQLSDGSVGPGPARALAAQRLADLDDKIRDLSTIRELLAGYLDGGSNVALVDALLQRPEAAAEPAKPPLTTAAPARGRPRAGR